MRSIPKKRSRFSEISPPPTAWTRRRSKAEYGDSAIVEKERERKLEDKVLKFIENEAVFVDTPEEAKEPETGPRPEEPEQA